MHARQQAQSHSHPMVKTDKKEEDRQKKDGDREQGGAQKITIPD